MANNKQIETQERPGTPNWLAQYHRYQKECFAQREPSLNVNEWCKTCHEAPEACDCENYSASNLEVKKCN